VHKPAYQTRKFSYHPSYNEVKAYLTLNDHKGIFGLFFSSPDPLEFQHIKQIFAAFPVPTEKPVKYKIDEIDRPLAGKEMYLLYKAIQSFLNKYQKSVNLPDISQHIKNLIDTMSELLEFISDLPEGNFFLGPDMNEIKADFIYGRLTPGLAIPFYNLLDRLDLVSESNLKAVNHYNADDLTKLGNSLNYLDTVCKIQADQKLYEAMIAHPGIQLGTVITSNPELMVKIANKSLTLDDVLKIYSDIANEEQDQTNISLPRTPPI
jgi:hypothetical protein